MIYGDDDSASRNEYGQLIELTDGQFEIGGVTLGGESDELLLDSFDPGVAEWLDQDASNPFTGGTSFGRDFLQGPTWSLEGFTNAYDINGALNAVDIVGQAWRSEWMRGIPGALQILRYRIGSKTRRVYGRGRKFSHAVDHRAYGGAAAVSMTFKLASNAYFDDDEQREIHMPIVPVSTGGLTAPLTAPLTAVGTGGVYAGAIPDVGGTAPTPFHLYIKGPVSRPYIQGRAFRLQLDMDIAYDQTIHVSTHGNFLVEDDRGTNFAGRLSPATRLSDAKLWPGPESVSFGGIDITGTAWAKIVWRPAYATL